MEKSPDIQRQPDLKIINNTFKIASKIDQGAFGKIYQAFDVRKKTTPGPHVAVKFQPLRSQNIQLIYECKIYHHLSIDPTYYEKGIPTVYYCGVQGQYNVLVMELMGPSLESILNRHRQFSLKTTIMLLDQMLTRIQYLHTRHILHRDIKPDNFCMGADDHKNKLFLLDFGLAKKYIRQGRHIPYREGKPLTGTVRYVSVNTHLGYQQSRRDDLESIAYVSIYLHCGSLPWQGLRGKNKQEKYLRIKQKKLKTSIDQICKDCPNQFSTFLAMIRALKFQQQPPYKALKNMFIRLLERQGHKYDYIYDWTIKNAQIVGKTNNK